MAGEDEAVRDMQDNLTARDQDIAQDGTSATRPTDDQDLDETRRLLYMLLFATRTKRYNLVGTVVNAMRHHQGYDGADLEDKVLAAVEDSPPDETWARSQIARITAELGQGGA